MLESLFKLTCASEAYEYTKYWFLGKKVFVFKCSPSLYWEKINETASIYHDMPYFVPA